MKKITVLLISLMLWSCQKEEDPAPAANTSPCLLTKIYFSVAASYTVVEYDSERKPVKYTFFSREAVHTESQYEYNKQRQIIRRTDRYQEAPLSVTTHTYEYNNAGQLTRYVRTGGAPRQSETNFEYDQSGYRVKMTQKDTYANRTVTFSRAYEYENGNLTREIYNPGLPDQTSIRYEYYSDKEDRRNQFPHSFLSTNWHSASKNIIRSSTVEPSNATVHFQYEYNAEGFPVKETRTHGNEPGSYADVILYEYDCQ